MPASARSATCLARARGVPLHERAAAAVGRELDLVIVATGTLHDDGLKPEKSLRQIDAASMQRVLAVNTVGPAMVARSFLPRLKRSGPATFAALSARVGSIADNRLGGWHSYRASKAALNMLIRTFSIEMRRTHPQARVIGLHPGTVDTGLSAPFQRNVPDGKLFTPDYSAERLLAVINALSAKDSGGVFDWAGERVPE
ncbi:MAG: SDR family NAD(P)-dependent oxidoreductase [Pseudomonadota bacterium]